MSKHGDLSDKTIIAYDFETDPFRYRRVPKPFAAGVYDGEVYQEQWGDDETCIRFILDLAEQWGDDAIFYAHNGGKFDLHFIIPYADTISDIVMIGSRIAQMKINGTLFRDSYAMIPSPLADMDKGEIDYALMESETRYQHKDEISRYLERDCKSLHKYVTAFIDEFGMHLTMAAAALKQLERFHPYKKMTGDIQDARFRNFYYGGRVEYFESGTLQGDFKIFDVNSMYPSVMKNFRHPVTDQFTCLTGKYCLHDNAIANCAFVELDCESEGALPWRDPDAKGMDKKLLFPHGRKRFFATGHELRMALKYNALKIHNIYKMYIPEETSTFAEFVDRFFEQRQKANAEGNKTYDLFYKLVLNSAYGKFAQDPAKFKEFMFSDGQIPEVSEGWQLIWHCSENRRRIYERPSRQPLFAGRKNVAIAASITGAARAVLFEGLRNATRPVYCDTDSIICLDLQNVRRDPKELGAWDLEKSGIGISIAGRKTYALHVNGGYAKVASKGVRATGEEIAMIAAGRTIKFYNMAPTFSLKKAPYFVSRKIKTHV